MGYLSCNAEAAIAVCDPYSCRASKRREKPPRKVRAFSYDELVEATKGFSAESFLGKGSHGSVYKAVLDNGKLVAAVKRTPVNSCRSLNHNIPAENEIEVLSRVRNPRLVNLIGFCVDSRDSSKLLVVEYMPNGSLYELLHCNSNASRPPGYAKRVRHALQIAKAVHALHSADPPVIHRDIKSSNVLIDGEGNARLGDFGLALRGHVEDVRVKCTPPAGTLGYLDPSYITPTDLSSKTDVFSFGILLLELISGRNAIDLNYSPPSVVDWAVPLIKRGDFDQICDPRIRTPHVATAVRIVAVLAARCVRSTAEKRPDMAEAVECLKSALKRSQAPPVCTNLRRRAGCVGRSETAFGYETVVLSESQEMTVRTNVRRSGSRRQRKVSSVEYHERPARRGGEGVSRSKSIGSINHHVIDDGGDVALIGREEANEEAKSEKSAAAAVAAAAAARLRKSRSTGVLRSHRLVRSKERVSSGEIDIFGLRISDLDEKSERELQEKPLVYI